MVDTLGSKQSKNNCSNGTKKQLKLETFSTVYNFVKHYCISLFFLFLL